MRGPATAKARGTALEHRVIAHLKALGWRTIRSAGSHGEADIWAAKAGRLLLLQPKRAGDLYTPEWNELLRAARDAGGEAVLVSAPLYGDLRFERLTDFRTPFKRYRPCETLEDL